MQGHNVHDDGDYLKTMSRPVQFHPSSGVHAEVFESVCSKECGVGEFKVSILNRMMKMIIVRVLLVVVMTVVVTMQITGKMMMIFSDNS